MSLRPYKFLVVPVLQEVNEDGEVVGEQQPQQPDHVFGTDALRAYADTFDAKLAAVNNGAVSR